MVKIEEKRMLISLVVPCYLVCIILLCSGVQLLCTGVAGEYLAKTYLETKHRPIYIAAETEKDLDSK